MSDTEVRKTNPMHRELEQRIAAALDMSVGDGMPPEEAIAVLGYMLGVYSKFVIVQYHSNEPYREMRRASIRTCVLNIENGIDV
jgi:hypothetical protein